MLHAGAFQALDAKSAKKEVQKLHRALDRAQANKADKARAERIHVIFAVTYLP